MEKLFHANRNDKSGGHGIVRQNRPSNKGHKERCPGTLYNDKRVNTRRGFLHSSATPKYVNTNRKGEIDENTIIADYNTLLLINGWIF